MSQEAVDITSFEQELYLDSDKLKELYLVFTEEIIKEKELIRKYSFLNMTAELSKSVHNLKGVSSNYRAHKLYEVTKKLDFKLKNQDFNHIDYYVMAVCELIDEATTEITKYFCEH